MHTSIDLFPDHADFFSVRVSDTLNTDGSLWYTTVTVQADQTKLTLFIKRDQIAELAHALNAYEGSLDPMALFEA